VIRGFELLFALAAAYDLKIEQIDVKTAFLYGKIDVDIYIEQPEGFCSKERPDQVYKLKKVLYGLKQVLCDGSTKGVSRRRHLLNAH
jgi:hypothetical protein